MPGIPPDQLPPTAGRRGLRCRRFRSGSSAKIRLFKDFDQLKRKVQSLLVVANPTFLVLLLTCHLQT